MPLKRKRFHPGVKTMIALIKTFWDHESRFHRRHTKTCRLGSCKKQIWFRCCQLMAVLVKLLGHIRSLARQQSFPCRIASDGAVAHHDIVGSHGEQIDLYGKYKSQKSDYNTRRNSWYMIRTNMLCIFNAPAHLWRIVWSRKAVFGASKWPSSCMKNLAQIVSVFSSFYCLDINSTLGRNDGCSSITELLRNFWSKQSFPWIANTQV